MRPHCPRWARPPVAGCADEVGRRRPSRGAAGAALLRSVVEALHPRLRLVGVGHIDPDVSGGGEHRLGHSEPRAVPHGDDEPLGQRGDRIDELVVDRCRCRTEQGHLVEKAYERGHGQRDSQTLGLAHAELPGTPLEQEFSDVTDPPGGQLPVPVGPLPLEGDPGVANQVFGLPLCEVPLIGQPAAEPTEEHLPGGSERLLVLVVDVE